MFLHSIDVNLFLQIKVISTFQNVTLKKKNKLEKLGNFSGVTVKVWLKLKDMSYHFTRILLMKGSHLSI